MSLDVNARPSAVRRAAATPAVAGHQPLAIALALAACFAAGSPARAQPSGAQAIAGSATLTQNGSRLTVTTQNGAGSNHSAINWQSFSIPAGSSTWFNQPGSTSTSINRVLGSNPSAIFGTLGSNGKLVLVNPAGITVGAGAVVDTAGFTASTLRMSDADALAGRLVFGGDGLDSASLQVGGTIVARGGDVVLIAPNVEVGDSGVVQSIDGSTILAAGRKVALTGRGLEGIQLELKAPSDQALNLGTLKGDSVGIFASQLRHSGAAQAQSASLEGGRLVLRADGDALVDGRLDASSAQGSGGSVDVLGNRVALFGSAQVDASGATGGGQVRIGGDYQGSNAAVPNAARSFVGAGVQVHADARDSGDGGRVIVWSDEMTRMQGHLSARGGSQGGDGGFAEVSGKQSLEFTGRADLRAPAGKAGSLLLDPNNITIVSDASGPTTVNPPPVPTPAPTPAPTPSPPPPPVPTPAPGGWNFSGGPPGVVTVTDLQDQLALGDVHVLTSGGTGGTGTITVAAGANVTWSTPNSLGLAADNGIMLNANITAATGKLSLNTAAGNISQGVGTIQVGQLVAVANAGSVILNQPNQVDTVAGIATSGFSFRNARPLTVGTVSTPFSGSIAGIQSNGGSVSVQTSGSGSHLTVGSAAPIDGQTGVVLAATGALSDVQLASGVIGHNGMLTINATRDIVVGSSGSVTLAGQQGLDLQAARNVDFLTTGSNYVSTYGGPVNVTAGGGITGSVQISTSGSLTPPNAHAVTLAAPDGVSFGSIYATGSFSTTGGAVTITSSGGSISGDAIQSPGGYSNAGNGTPGGPVTLSTPNGSVAVNSISTQGGGSNTGSAGAGGNVTINARNGITGSSINASGGYANGGTGGAGGTVTLTTSNGNVWFNSIDVSGGGGVTGGAGGTVVVSAPSQAVEEGEISIYETEAYGAEGDGGAGGRGGNVTFSAGKRVSADSVDVSGGNAYPAEVGPAMGGAGGAGGTITVTSAAGDILGSYLAAWGGNGAAGFAGGAGGTVNVTAQTGDIILSSCECEGSIYASGGYGDPGGRGGSVIVSAPHGAVNLYDIEAYGGGGGASSGGGNGGAGGSISVSAINLYASYLEAPGGQGGDNAAGAGGNGGSGGSIGVTSTGADAEESLSLSGLWLTATGGHGGTGSTSGGSGGAGGSVAVNAPFGADGTATWTQVDGGYGGNANGTDAGSRGGHGASGGSVTLNFGSGGGSGWSGALSAVGGNGGNVPASGSATGGNAGSGGTVNMIVGSGALLNAAPSVSLRAGIAGEEGTPAPAGPMRAGMAAAAGTLFTSGAGGVTTGGAISVDGNWNNQLAVTLGGAGSIFTSGLFTNGSAGKIELAGTAPTPIVSTGFSNAGLLKKTAPGVQTVALAQNTGTVSVQAGELVLQNFSTNNGVLEIGAVPQPTPAPILSIGTPFSAGPSAATLTNFGTIRGRGMLNTSLVNSGVVAPGMSPGQLTIGGNFSQTAGGTLVMEIGGPIAGTDYDQLSVLGATQLGGSLQVLPFGATPPSTGSFNILTGSAPTGSFAFVGVPSGFAGTLIAGGAPVAISPAPTPIPTPPATDTSPPPGTDTSPPPATDTASAPPPPTDTSTTPPPTDTASAPPPPAQSPPPAPPAPVPPPASAANVDQIVALLRNGTSRDQVEAALGEQNGLVTQFVTLLLKEEKQQADDRRNDGDITITDTQCKP